METINQRQGNRPDDSRNYEPHQAIGGKKVKVCYKGTEYIGTVEPLYIAGMQEERSFVWVRFDLTGLLSFVPVSFIKEIPQ